MSQDMRSTYWKLGVCSTSVLMSKNGEIGSKAARDRVEGILEKLCSRNLRIKRLQVQRFISGELVSRSSACLVQERPVPDCMGLDSERINPPRCRNVQRTFVRARLFRNATCASRRAAGAGCGALDLDLWRGWRSREGRWKVRVRNRSVITCFSPLLNLGGLHVFLSQLFTTTLLEKLSFALPAIFFPSCACLVTKT